ncbi:acyl-CoA reductase [Candidatus Omnitrophota bacterium]
MLVKILLPKRANREWRRLLSQITLVRPMKPFASLSLAFMQEVSKVLMIRERSLNSELKKLTHWTNKAHLMKIYQDYKAKRQDRFLLPRGVVLHFTPANIDSLFVYSWFMSLLMGNSNVIRLSRNKSPQITLLLEVLNNVLSQKRFRPIQERSLIVSYGHQQEITKELSQRCHVRVIWGGDQTIREIRAVSLPSRAIEIVFADRFSIAAIKAETVLAASAREVNKLAKNTYHDTLFFTQKGCFSPKLFFWIGKKKAINNAKQRFWSAIEKLASQEEIDWPKGIGIARMTTGYRYAAEGIADELSTVSTKFPYRIHLQKVKKNLREIHSGGGIFLEAEKTSLMAILELIVPKDQTLSVYGFSGHELKRFASQLSGYGLDRIVPIGQASNFQVVWDGYDLFTYFTREVTINALKER